MRVFAVSDVHVDYAANKRWVADLSASDYRDDVLILAGDISHSTRLLAWCLDTLAPRFAKVLYVPGNHDLWVIRDEGDQTSMDKFQQVREIAENCGASMRAFHCDGLSIVPLLGWYDYSFGEPTSELLDSWVDFRACRWPDRFSINDVARHFLQFNERVLDVKNETVISFSHFLPRIDLMPNYIPGNKRLLYPVLGSTGLEAQIRRLRPGIHVYGHSHVNRNVTVDGVSYINNAYGYPQEVSITAKRLVCIDER